MTIVVIVNGLKDFFEDWKRKVSDDEENSRKTLILNNDIGKFEEKKWKDVKLGNIIKVNEDEVFPSDIILINSSEKNGICYIETKILGEETSLKHKVSARKHCEYY